MPRTTELQLEKEERIKAEIKKLRAERRLHPDYIFQQVAQKYFLSISTVTRIFWGEYDRNRERKAERGKNGQGVGAAPLPVYQVASRPV